MTNILNETPVGLAELKEELERIKKRDGELNFRANKAEDYLNQLNLDSAESKKLFKKIMDLKIPRVKEQHIYKILDIMPKTAEDLKVVIQGYPISVSNENVKKVVDLINKASD